MKLNSQIVYVLASALLTTVCWAATVRPGESIVRDPATGDYIINYWNTDMEPPGIETTTFVPATKIAPTIRSKVGVGGAGSFVYRYSIGNGTQSKQTLIHLILDPVGPIIGTRSTRGMKWGTLADKAARMAILEANEKSLTTPLGWSCSVAFDVGGRTDGSVRIGWRASVEHSTGLKPGNSIANFGFSSMALPGIIEAQLSGDAPVPGWSGEGPPEDSAIIQQLNEIEAHNFVSRSAAVPTIAVPAPFDAAMLLDRIRTHFLTWQGKQLVEPAFASQLDRYLVAATEAFRRNQIKAGKEHLETIHEMLEKEHKHLDGDDEGDEQNHDKEHRSATRPNIDRLAARVLDFDLKYVLKRLEEGKEKAEKKGKD